ncbi:MAG: enoyl-CoA hydratase-related protein [Pseudomonadota bacterium]
MSEQVVEYQAADGIATITLNRPESLNAMNNELMGGISTSIDQVREDESVRVVVITGRGRGFCAGADLKQTAEGSGSEGGSGDFFTTAMRDIYDCPVPTIARVNGAAAGGGLGLALATDITIAGDSAFFVATFGPRLGIVPDMGATWSIPNRVGRARAMGLTLLGDRITAQQAQEMGLIWAAVPDNELDDAVADTAARLARCAPAAMTRIRQSIDAAANNTFSRQLDLEMAHQAVLIPRNMQAAAVAFVEKREPEFSGRRD